MAPTIDDVSNPFGIYDQRTADWVRRQQAGEDVAGDLLYKGYTFHGIRSIGDPASRTLEFTISTQAKDRYQDTIAVNGWDLANFQRNPVVLWAHSHIRPPVARSPEVGVKSKRLRAVAEFTPAKMSEFNDMVFDMLLRGFLNATSVGFGPMEWNVREDDLAPWGVAYDFTKQELLEFSIVPVPANPECLISAKSGGVDLAPMLGWVEEALDTWAEQDGGIFLPRSAIERTYDILNGERTVLALGVVDDEESEAIMERLRTYDLERTVLTSAVAASVDDPPMPAPEPAPAKDVDPEPAPDPEPAAAVDPAGVEVRFFDENGNPIDEASGFLGEIASIELDGEPFVRTPEPTPDPADPPEPEPRATESTDEVLDEIERMFGLADDVDPEPRSEGDDDDDVFNLIEAAIADGGDEVKEVFRTAIDEAVRSAIAQVRGALPG